MSGKAWGAYLRSSSAACARLCSSGEVLTMSSSSGTRWLGSTGAGFFLPKRMPAWAGVARAAAVVTRARMLCHFIRWPPGCSQGLCDNTPPPHPLPASGRGSRRSFSPSPLRGGGRGGGVFSYRPEGLSAAGIPCLPCRPAFAGYSFPARRLSRACQLSPPDKPNRPRAPHSTGQTAGKPFRPGCLARHGRQTFPEGTGEGAHSSGITDVRGLDHALAVRGSLAVGRLPAAAGVPGEPEDDPLAGDALGGRRMGVLAGGLHRVRPWRGG